MRGPRVQILARPSDKWPAIEICELIHSPLYSKTAHADARLMVAAPDLLKAAKFALDIVFNSPVDQALTAYEQLQAAIEKAESEEGS